MTFNALSIEKLKVFFANCTLCNRIALEAILNNRITWFAAKNISTIYSTNFRAFALTILVNISWYKTVNTVTLVQKWFHILVNMLKAILAYIINTILATSALTALSFPEPN